MKLLNRLERKIGRFALPNLMFFIVICQFAVFAAQLIFPEKDLVGLLMLDRGAIINGQVWRLISFIFIPPSSSIIFMVFSLYFYYMIGSSLESQWGSFKFNVYYLMGMIGTIAAAFITGYGINTYLNFSLFFAFAVLFPNYEISLFFIVPIKVKYLAVLDAVFFIVMFIRGDWSIRLSIIAALINFFLFFGGDFIKFIKDQIYYSKTRRNFKNTMNKR